MPSVPRRVVLQRPQRTIIADGQDHQLARGLPMLVHPRLAGNAQFGPVALDGVLADEEAVPVNSRVKTISADDRKR